jgi:hypothetical protein
MIKLPDWLLSSWVFSVGGRIKEMILIFIYWAIDNHSSFSRITPK